jgi:hypothetical protein
MREYTINLSYRYICHDHFGVQDSPAYRAKLEQASNEWQAHIHACLQADPKDPYFGLLRHKVGSSDEARRIRSEQKYSRGTRKETIRKSLARLLDSYICRDCHTLWAITTVQKNRVCSRGRTMQMWSTCERIRGTKCQQCSVQRWSGRASCGKTCRFYLELRPV